MGLISRVSSRTYRKSQKMGCVSSGHGKKRNRQKKFNKVYHKMKRAGKLTHDDQIFDNLTIVKKSQALKNQKIDLEKAGLGQNYCLVWNRYFNDKKATENHERGKSHKQKVKQLIKEKPFTHKEAEMASGKGSYFKPVVTEIEQGEILKNCKPVVGEFCPVSGKLLEKTMED